MATRFDHLPAHEREDWEDLDDAMLWELFNKSARDVKKPDGNTARMSRYDAAWCFGAHEDGDMFVPYVCYSINGKTHAMAGEPQKTERSAVLTAAQHEKMMKGELTQEELAELGQMV